MSKCVKIVVSVVVIFLYILFVCAFYRVNKIIELMRVNSNIGNYYFESESLVKVRYKDIIIVIPSKYTNSYYYYDFKIKKWYLIDKDNKTYFENNIEASDRSVLNFPLYDKLTDDYSLKSKLKLLFSWNISEFDNTKYEIRTKDDFKIVFDNETGFVLRVNDLYEEYDQSLNTIEINGIRKEYVKLPNLEEYTKCN